MTTRGALWRAWRWFTADPGLHWWLRWRFDPRHRYNIVRTALPPGYHEPDELILHASMACLCRFIENSEGAEALAAFSAELREPDPECPWLDHSSQADFQDEAVAIYRWWTRERPQSWALNERQMMSIFGDDRSAPLCSKVEHWAHEERLHAEDEAMLVRLAKIRRSLWT